MAHWLLAVILGGEGTCLSDPTDREWFVYRSMPLVAKQLVWAGLDAAGWVYQDLDFPDWDNFDGVMNAMRGRMNGDWLPYPLDPLGPLVRK